ncbi:MAG: alpha/beta hydrolase [Clostridia bacterium]|nr:alpha/beta hydrolase [Clostridia bacterium]
MFYEFRGKKVHLKKTKGKGDWIVFLHGWGGTIKSFECVAEKFTEHKCLLIDFPPFGESEEMVDVWNLSDYVEMLREILNAFEIDKVKIIAHSFGGRVAILFASIYTDKVEKLILVDSAGIKPKFNIIVKLKILKYKILKKIGFKQKNKGSADYKLLSSKMKKTFVNIINEHLEKQCERINCPTLIIFGKKDKETPIYMAKKLNSLIKNSAVIIFKNARHFSYIDNFNDFILIAKSFLN